MVILFLILLSVFLVSCLSGPHNTNAVKRFVRENISKSPINITGPETDKWGWKYWTINFEDKPDYKFWVDSRGSSVFGIPAGYVLSTNFNTAFSYYYLIEFKERNDCLLDSKIDSTIYPRGSYYIEGYYSSKEEAIILADGINKYYDFVNQQKYPCKIEIVCYYIPAQNDDQIKNYYLKLYLLEEYANKRDWTHANNNYEGY
jgi:hypothetical protein